MKRFILPLLAVLISYPVSAQFVEDTIPPLRIVDEGDVAAVCTHGSQSVTAAGAGSYTIPAGSCTSLTIEAWGAGGAGDGSASGFAPGGGGGAYAKTTGLTVVAGTTVVYYSVGTGGTAGGSYGSDGTGSWANISANSQPASTANGAYADPGHASGAPGNNGGLPGLAASSVGATKYDGGTACAGNYTYSAGGTASGGGGGGGAGSGGAGGSCVAATNTGYAGGAGGTPDGGKGGDGANVASGGGVGTQPGGGGGGNWGGASTGNGGNGKVVLTW